MVTGTFALLTGIHPDEVDDWYLGIYIDALEWVGPSLDLNMGFQKIAPYYYTGWHEPATELQFMVNKAAFDSLPAHFQEILTIAMQYAAYDMYARSYHESAVNWASIEKEYPEVKIRTFSPEIIAAMKQFNQELLEESAELQSWFEEEKAFDDEQVIQKEFDKIKIVDILDDSPFGFF